MNTVLETIQAGSAYFEKHGVEDARLNMEHLLASVLGCKRLDLYMDFDKPLGEEELAPMRELLKRRAKGEPLQHLIGTAEFFGRVFLCDQRALVPRPETERLVEILLERTKTQEASGALRILDMGTGSGVIGLTLAIELKERFPEVFLIDSSDEALSLARENSVRVGVDPDRIHFRKSDLFTELDETFEIIAANLPYVASEEMAGLSREVQCDPASALDGGPGGCEMMDRFLAEVPGRLAEGGLLGMEIGTGQGAHLAGAAEKAGLSGVELLEDLAGRERFLLARK